VYHVAIDLTPATARGTWTVSGVSLDDVTSHHAELDAAGVAARATGGLAIEQVGDPDTVRPILDSVSFSPDVVDGSTGFTIQMTAAASDAQTGINQVDCNLSPPSGWDLRHWLAFAATPWFSNNIVSGDAYDGTFRSGVVVDAGILEPGVWTGYCFAVDEAGNRSLSFPAPAITIN